MFSIIDCAIIISLASKALPSRYRSGFFREGFIKALFYCVGFPNLANAWARSGHVSNHEIFLTEDEAKKAKDPDS